MGRTAVIFFFLLFIITGTASAENLGGGGIAPDGTVIGLRDNNTGELIVTPFSNEDGSQNRMPQGGPAVSVQTNVSGGGSGEPSYSETDYGSTGNVSQEWSPPPENKAGGGIVRVTSTVKGIAKMADGTPVGLSGFEPKKPEAIIPEEKVKIQVDDPQKHNPPRENKLQRVLVSYEDARKEGGEK